MSLNVTSLLLDPVLRCKIDMEVSEGKLNRVGSIGDLGDLGDPDVVVDGGGSTRLDGGVGFAGGWLYLADRLRSKLPDEAVFVDGEEGEEEGDRVGDSITIGVTEPLEFIVLGSSSSLGETSFIWLQGGGRTVRLRSCS